MHGEIGLPGTRERVWSESYVECEWSADVQLL